MLIISLCAAAVLAGCEKENTVKGLPMTEDGTAYIAVKISSEPGIKGTDMNFEYGSEDEHKVTSADFYFYDAQGTFVSQAKVWNGGNANNQNPDENIEYFGNNVVMLKGLTEKTFPKYVVTILNQPEGFTPGVNLKAMEDNIIGAIKSGDNFIMTTTSYVHGGTGDYAGSQPIYFANEVVEANFVKDPDGDVTATPVVIYVERLAAKVKLSVDEALVPVAGTDNTYELKVSVAGDPNDTSAPAIGSETVRIRLEGWGLNATAKQTHIVKNIKNDWNLGGFDWNEVSNFRSLWGMGTAYDKEYDANGTYGTYLNYNKWTEFSAHIGDNLYCAENTNTAAKLDGHLGNAATSVVLTATVLLKDGENWVEGDLIRYSGLLYNAKDFKAYVLNNLNTLGQLKYYKKTQADATHFSYTQVGVDDIEVVLATEGDNKKVTLALTAEAEGATWVSAFDEENGTDTPADITGLKNALKGFTGTGYKGGKMFYNIPIEHLFEDGTEAIAEGEYGVVRNHYYKLTVTSLNKLGNGVWNPGTGELPIIPENPEDPDEYYQVGVQINILSWRVVSQDVEL